MNKDTLRKIDMKNDGKDGERFGKLLKTVASVPKERVKEYEEKQKKKAKKTT